MPAENVNSSLPRDFPYSPGDLLSGEALVQCLPTLDELVVFWTKHRDKRLYGAASDSSSQNWFLQPYQWIFAPDIPALIRALVRWDELEVRPIWYNWAEKLPNEHTAHFRERDRYRRKRIAAGAWTHEQEREFQSDPRTPETYRGWWELKTSTTRLTAEHLLPELSDEIFDPDLTLSQVEEAFQVQIFEGFKGGSGCGNDVETFDCAALDACVAYWLDERRYGRDYYGSENE